MYADKKQAKQISYLAKKRKQAAGGFLQKPNCNL